MKSLDSMHFKMNKDARNDQTRGSYNVKSAARFGQGLFGDAA